MARVHREEHAVVVVTSEVERGVCPGGEVARATELLGGVRSGRLAHVVDKQDRDVVLALQGAQGTEHSQDVARAVLVEPRNKPDKGVEDEQPGRVLREGPAESVEVGRIVEPELGDVEQEYGSKREVEVAGARDAAVIGLGQLLAADVSSPIADALFSLADAIPLRHLIQEVGRARGPSLKPGPACTLGYSSHSARDARPPRSDGNANGRSQCDFYE